MDRFEFPGAPRELFDTGSFGGDDKAFMPGEGPAGGRGTPGLALGGVRGLTFTLVEPEGLTGRGPFCLVAPFCRVLPTPFPLLFFKVPREPEVWVGSCCTSTLGSGWLLLAAEFACHSPLHCRS
jgi:hypothetical protein